MRESEEIKLRPKSFEVLKFLVENPGRLVSKDELIQAVWMATAVTDESLVQCLKDVRRALGDEAQQIIQTVPRRGYIFRKEVSETGPNIYTEETSSVHIVIEETAESNSGALLYEPSFSRNGTVQPALAGAIAPAPSISKAALIIDTIKRHKLATAFTLTSLALVGSGLAYGLFLFFSRPATSPFRNVGIRRLTTDGKAGTAAISPDGKYVAYTIADAGMQSVWVRQVAAVNSTQIIAPADADYTGLTFSTDGNFVYCVRSGALYQVPAWGGPLKKVWDGVNSQLTISPDGRRLAFVRKGNGQSSLVLANADGTGEPAVLAFRRLPDFFTWSPADGCAWSPDGATIACSGGEGGGFGQRYPIAVRVSDGKQWPMTAQRWNHTGQVAWLDDGSGIVMNANGNLEPNSQLWYVPFPREAAVKIYHDLTGYGAMSMTANSAQLVSIQLTTQSNLRAINPFEEPRRVIQITSGGERDDGALAVTPDGRIICESETGGSRDLWIMDADGSNEKQLTSDPSRETMPTVSPDGRSLVFVTLGQEIWKSDIDGNTRRQLSKNGLFPQYSPDGNWIVFSSPADKWALMKMPSGGGDALALTGLPSFQPAISPDGSLIAYMEVRPRIGTKTLKVIPFAGGAPLYTFDVPNLQSQFDVEWSPDGKAITYNAVQDGVGQIVNQPLDGSPPSVLIESRTEQLGAFAWSRDGKRLYFTAGPVSRNVVLFDLTR
ncbi:MAG: winged helix-turn-helix domain-containing protein [Pyrinomonadaceae bacterium]